MSTTVETIPTVTYNGVAYSADIDAQVGEYLSRFVIPERRAFAVSLIRHYVTGEPRPNIPAELMIATAKGKVPGDAIVKRVEGMFKRARIVPEVIKDQGAKQAARKVQVDATSDDPRVAALVASGLFTREQAVAMFPSAAPVDPRIVALTALGISEAQAVEMLKVLPAPMASLNPANDRVNVANDRTSGRKPRSAAQLANDERLRQQAIARNAQRRTAQGNGQSAAERVAVEAGLSAATPVTAVTTAKKASGKRTVAKVSSLGALGELLAANPS